MNDECVHNEESGESEPVSFPFNPWGMLFNVAQYLGALAGTTSTFLNILATDFGAHNNDLMERRKAAEQERARREMAATLENIVFSDVIEPAERGEAIE